MYTFSLCVNKLFGVRFKDKEKETELCNVSASNQRRPSRCENVFGFLSIYGDRVFVAIFPGHFIRLILKSQFGIAQQHHRFF